jgi:hypothetical protein
MPDININISSNPPFEIFDEKIYERIANYELDQDIFRRGLVLAGAPEVTAETLIINFSTPTYDGHAMDSRYDSRKHTIGFDIGTQSGIKINYRDVEPWNATDSELTDGYNFSLAYHCKRIADVSRRQQETLVWDRSNDSSQAKRELTLYGVTVLGAITGAQIADSTGNPVWLGGLVGGASAAAIDISSLITLDLFKNRNTPSAIAEKISHQRAIDFASSEEAKQLFSQVAKLELK